MPFLKCAGAGSAGSAKHAMEAIFTPQKVAGTAICLPLTPQLLTIYLGLPQFGEPVLLQQHDTCHPAE